jgi:hypothetical protein
MDVCKKPLLEGCGVPPLHFFLPAAGGISRNEKAFVASFIIDNGKQ